MIKLVDEVDAFYLGVEFTLRVEEVLHVAIPDDVIRTHDSLDELCKYIGKAKEQSGDVMDSSEIRKHVVAAMRDTCASMGMEFHDHLYERFRESLLEGEPKGGKAS
jgi:hypothetical protein